ncbi:Na+/H+ antiporter subunit E [Vulgatibacter sp.]|uniref:Na+/H+ antiporter subunit E n=1 Tax=Vulgatibacter sp. TaxID=1971226 RepID=UPI003569E09C
MIRIPGWLIYLLALLPLWVVAAGSFHPVQLGWGLVVGLVTLPLSWRIFDLHRAYDAGALAHGIFGGFRFFVVDFVPDAIRSTLDMSRRVVQPVVPMRPGVIAVPLRFRGNADALFLTNDVTLTPGQLVIDIDEERGILYVHAIDAHDPDRIRRDVQAVHRKALLRLYR